MISSKKLPEKNYSNTFLEYMWGGRNYFEKIFPYFRFSWTGKMPRIHQKYSNFSKYYWMSTFYGLKVMDWQTIVKKLDSLLLYTRIKAILAPEMTEKRLFCLDFCFYQNFISQELLVVSRWLTTHFIQNTYLILFFIKLKIIWAPEVTSCGSFV